MKYPFFPAFVLLVLGLSCSLLADAARSGRAENFKSRPNIAAGRRPFQHGGRSSTGARRNFNPRNINGKHAAAPKKFVPYQGDKVPLTENGCRYQEFKAHIRHVQTKEYLYAAADDLVVDDKRRRVFTWADLYDVPGAPNSTWRGQEVWRIKFLESKEFIEKSSPTSFSDIHIQSEKTGEFLYCSPDGNSSVYTWRAKDRDQEISVEKVWSVPKCLKLGPTQVYFRSSCAGRRFKDDKVLPSYLQSNVTEYHFETFKRRQVVLPFAENEELVWEIIPV